MDEKRKDSAGTPPAPIVESPAPATEPLTSSRRRGGGQKRKLASINSSGGGLEPQTMSSKRQARDKPPVVPLPPIHLNGPFTRARVHPNGSNNLSTSIEVNLGADSRDVVAEGDLIGMSDNLEALEEKIEAEYEAIISRNADVHVVPIHAGWFSWTKIHPLEERMLPSFFDGKSESRTPEIYMEIRNWVMKKFHLNPNSQIELEQLTEFTVGDSDTRQEVIEFLDYWGLINYHPFPKNEPTNEPKNVANDDDNDDEARKKDSSLEKLFQFETVESWTPMVTRADSEVPAMPSGLLPESVVADELVKSEGPDVGYHCNSCSTDCSRKRYHCQKQADFDLCAECFDNRKFGSDMSPSDFILMEPAEAGGGNGGKWTDQETLLLLEAIELFRDNWSEIAEHVATKTKAQCILHFVQMPIEDAFCNSDDENVALNEIELPASVVTENPSPISGQDRDSAIKVVPEKMDSQDGTTDNLTSSCQVDISNPEDDNSHKNLEATENFALKALKEAFEAVGSLSSSGQKLSFAEAGNPVMTLASFLVRLVEPNIATASIQSCLKALSSNHSGEELSARHCFRLEDPPDDNKNLAPSDGAASGSVEVEAPKDENEHVENLDEGTPESVDGIGVQDDDNDENKNPASGGHKAKDSASELNVVDSTNSECAENICTQNDSDGIVTHEDSLAALSRKSGLPRKRSLKDSEIHSSYLKESQDGLSAGELCQSQEPSKDDLTSYSEKKDTEIVLMSNSIAEKEECTGDREDRECGGPKKNPLVNKNNIDINKLKRAALTALSAAAVKAKLLAEQEEDQIRQLAIFLVEKQLHKLETKLAFFSDLENVVIRVKEQLDRSKQRLFQERAQIIAARLGMQATARHTSQHLPPNRAPANVPNLGSRPMMGINALRPPISRPLMAPNFASNPLMSGRAAGSSIPPNLDKFSSFGTR